jgi:molecular chaperone GrpE
VSKEKDDTLHGRVEVTDEDLSPPEKEQGGNENEAHPEEENGRDLEKELADALKEIDELRDRMLRAAAENENFKKRMERERASSLKYAGEQIFREMLPVVDNLERAIEQSSIEGNSPEQRFESLVEGVKLTLKSLVSTLEKFEVKPIESVGEPFDPKHQDALTMEASDTVPANHVVSEFEKGYYYKDRLLRAAKVIVSSGEKEADS